jgi:hypothetical protein
MADTGQHFDWHVVALQDDHFFSGNKLLLT